MRDLGARVAVAGVGIPAFLALAYLGGWALGVPLALVAALGAGEVYRFAECRGVRPMGWLGMAGAAAVVLAAVVRPDFATLAPWALGVLGAVLLLGLVVALAARSSGESPLAAVATTLFGVAYAGLPLTFILLLHALPTRLAWGALHPSPWAGLAVVTLPLAATWIGDAAAYFVGSAWGRSKLFPSVSPGKTWVGAWAGVLAGAGAGVGWLMAVRSVLPGLPVSGVGVAASIGAALGVGAIVGDLAESLLKREAGMKNSGRTLPGHGGILDRLDALSFTVPLAYAMLWVLELLA